MRNTMEGEQDVHLGPRRIGWGGNMDVHPEHADALKLGAEVVGAVDVHHPVAIGIFGDRGRSIKTGESFLRGCAVVATD